MVTYRVLIYRVSIEWSHIECSHRVVTHTLHFVFIFTLFGVSCRDNFSFLLVAGPQLNAVVLQGSARFAQGFDSSARQVPQPRLAPHGNIIVMLR